MTPHFLRATHLIGIGRHEAAEVELRRELGESPHNGLAHSLLASCLLEREQYDEATTEAQLALGLAPDDAFAHYTLARIWDRRNYLDRAVQAIHDALQLAPDNADYYEFLASLHLQASRWSDALEAAETGLACDAEHVGCNNFRAMALVKLGRKAEAGMTIDAALARAPEDSFSHANMGWTLLESRRTNEALDHFREALRLDPTNEYARSGLVEALKARYPFYGIFLAYMLWMRKLTPQAQWGVIVGGWFGYQFVLRTAKANPHLAPYLQPLLVVYIVFVIFTWLADPIFNMLLRLNSFGRHALSDDERRETNWIGAALLIAALSFGLSLVSDFFSPFSFAAIIWAFLALPIHLVFSAHAGRPQQILIAATAGMFLLSLAWLGTVYTLQTSLASQLTNLITFGMIGIMWGGQAIAQSRPKL
ncbi:MAG: tetratricopeptide repeat protein [Planctomycetaceae bacterium]|nr:tetratricopeptide repeat protein [Planctomycetaceae bacterium]